VNQAGGGCALASGGRRVLLIEVEGRQGIAQLFDRAPLPYAEQRIASAPGDGEVSALAVDAEAALLEYLATMTPHDFPNQSDRPADPVDL